jgi:hypothetical protein
MTLRSLRQEPHNIAPLDIYLLAERCREIEIVGDGKTHRVVFAAATSGPPRSGPQPTPAEIDEPPFPALAEIPATEPAEIPQPEPEPSRASAGEIPDSYYEKMLAELRGSRRISSRYGGAPRSMLARTRRPMIDLEAGGQNVEAQTAIAKLESGEPIGKRYARRAIEMRELAAQTQVGKPAVQIARHRQTKNAGGQRPGDAAVPREERKYDLVLKHKLERNRRPVSGQIDSANPKPHPPLPC